jgi:GT2 family glycosyltransferase
MKRSPGTGALSCKCLHLDGRVQPVAGRFPSIAREVKDLFRLHKHLNQEERAEVYLGTEFDYNTDREVDWVWATFFMFRREVLQLFPDRLLPDDFFMYYEDVMWCHEIKNAGYKVMFSKEGEVYHIMKGSDNDAYTDVFARYKKKILKNEYAFLKKYKGWWYARLFYFIKAVNYFSLRTQENRRKGNAYFYLAMTGQV